MIFRSLNSDGDWTLGNGLQNYAHDEAAIALDISTALKVFLGECPWATDAGVDWWNLLGGKDQVNLLLQTRQVIASRDGVTKITSVEAFLDRATRRLAVTYKVDTIYSRNLTNTVLVP